MARNLRLDLIESLKYLVLPLQTKVNLIEYLKSLYDYKKNKQVLFPSMMVRLKKNYLEARANTMDSAHLSLLYEKETSNFLIKSKPSLFIDVGAHIGRFSVLLASENSEVISIEADKETFEQLVKNIERNNLGQNISEINVGCTNKKGSGRLYMNELNEGGNSLKKKVGLASKRVKLDTLDNLLKNKIKDKGGKKVLKIDVEGEELNVLKGGQKFLKKFSPLLVIEILDKSSELKIKGFLKKLNYKPKKVLDFRNFVFEKD